jgi:hypothetical protein
MKRRPGARGAPDLVILNTGGAKGTDLKDWLGHAIADVIKMAKKNSRCFEAHMMKNQMANLLDEK